MTKSYINSRTSIFIKIKSDYTTKYYNRNMRIYNFLIQRIANKYSRQYGHV